MQVSDKLIKPLTEAKYLNADNVSRYRCIMRIFFEHYEKLKYWLYQEEVYEEMIQDPLFADYRLEQCQQDLTMLTEWKNLNTIQDTKKVASIEEFKNKKYRYQMTEYSVEIERLVIRLENLFIEGASLEPTLLERIRRSVEHFPDMAGKDLYCGKSVCFCGIVWKREIRKRKKSIYVHEWTAKTGRSDGVGSICKVGNPGILCGRP